MRKPLDIRDGLRMRNVYTKKERIYIKKGGTRGSGNAAEPLRPMASKISKKFCVVRFRLRSAAVNGSAVAGSVADFLRYTLFLENSASHA